MLSPAGLLKVVPIQGAPNFTLNDQEELMLITPCKTDPIADSTNVSRIRLFLADFVSALRGDVKLFESQVNTRDGIEWVQIPIL